MTNRGNRGKLYTVSTRRARVLKPKKLLKQRKAGVTVDLTPRKKLILSEIVKAHIAHGEPVGSKFLCQTAGLNFSSATIRNEMSDLCEMGYLEQPHTSAGRVPTAAGYRMYVTGLLDKNTLSAPMQESIDRAIEKVAGNPGNITATAGQVLSELTGFTTVAMTIPEDKAFVKRVELLPMGKRMALLVLVTSDGIARSRICRTGENLTMPALKAFDRLVAVEVVGKELTAFSGVFLQTVAVQMGEYAFMLMPLISALFEMVENLCRSQIDLKGESNLYSVYKEESDARRLVEFISRRDAILSILSDIPDPVSVVFGDDLDAPELKPAGMVVAKFGSNDKTAGRIGIIGPTRMAYEDLIPSISYFAKQLGKVLEQSIRDMDDE